MEYPTDEKEPVQKVIRSIGQGVGEGSLYHEVGHTVGGHIIHRIEQREKNLGNGLHCNLTLLVYVGYDALGNELFEISHGQQTHVYYQS